MITYTPEKDIMLEKVLDEYVLVYLQTGEREHSRTVQINRTGADIWKLLEARTDPKTITETLSKKYEGTLKETIEHDIKVFLESLYSLGYLKKVT